MIKQTYTLMEIKKAFWEIFHESGELWFSYLGDPEDNEACTVSKWDEFVKELDKANKDGE